MNKIKVAVILHGLGANGIDTLFANLSSNWDLDRFEITYFIAVDKDDKQLWEEKVINNGVKVIHISDLDGTKLLKWPFVLKKCLKHYGPFDVIHVNMDMLNGINLLVAKNLKIKNRICHSHISNSEVGSGSFKAKLKKTYIKIMKKLMCHYSTKRVACSDLAGDYFFGKGNFQTIDNGVDIDKFIKTKNDNCNSKLKFCTIGRIVPQKNPFFLADIVEALYKIDNKIKFYWVGEGGLSQEVKKYVNKLSVNNNIHFLGVRNDVENVLHKCKYFLLPSNYEGFGLVLVEAQAAGLDCFASDVVPNTVNCGKCKFLSLEMSATDWARQIYDYINSKEKMVLNEQKLKTFGIKNMAEKIQDVYADL